MKVVACLPSRGRPTRLAHFLETASRHKAVCRIDIFIDTDDPCLSVYLKQQLPSNVCLIAGQRVGIGRMMNMLLHRHPEADCYGLLNDDLSVMTDNWDTILGSAAGHWHVAWPNDQRNSDKLATLPFVGGELVRHIGWYGLVGASRTYVDTVWWEIGRRYDCLRYCKDVLLRADQPKDETWYKPRELKQRDREAYDAFIAGFNLDPKVQAAIAAGG